MIFRALEEIKAQVRQNTLLLQALAKKQPPPTTMSLSDDFKFPIQSLEELRKVEKVLADKLQQKALTSYLATLGGVNPGDIVRRIMCHLLSDALAVQFNWLGRRGQKMAFSALSLTAVIRGAVAVQNVTASDCEVSIKNWLKYSGDRNGGRKRRAEQQQGPVNGMSQTKSIKLGTEN
ncbi:hypothetical protein ACEWY4_018248 [Coilia grayii]|uniref:DUF4806 domain-containing protein n=1 Tax=Coilia grayii TaxID=363190 RepID=A0ABD1JK91_9TELE